MPVWCGYSLLAAIAFQILVSTYAITSSPCTDPLCDDNSEYPLSEDPGYYDWPVPIWTKLIPNRFLMNANMMGVDGGRERRAGEIRMSKGREPLRLGKWDWCSICEGGDLHFFDSKAYGRWLCRAWIGVGLTGIDTTVWHFDRTVLLHRKKVAC